MSARRATARAGQSTDVTTGATPATRRCERKELKEVLCAAVIDESLTHDAVLRSCTQLPTSLITDDHPNPQAQPTPKHEPVRSDTHLIILLETFISRTSSSSSLAQSRVTQVPRHTEAFSLHFHTTRHNLHAQCTSAASACRPASSSAWARLFIEPSVSGCSSPSTRCIASSVVRCISAASARLRSLV